MEPLQFLRNLPSRFWVFVSSILVLILAQVDFGATGAAVFIALFAAFIFMELHFIRSTLVQIYADAVTAHPILLVFLRSRAVNLTLSGVISLYLAFYLFIYVNLITPMDFVFFLIAGGLLSLLSGPTEQVADNLTKEKPSKVFSRVGLVFVVVLLTVLLDALYNAFLPVDSRILLPFDVDIPLYVTQDLEHSWTSLQHFLRTALYFRYNIQSIGLSEEAGYWFSAIRFFLLLSPTPYVAYALLFLSFSAIRRFAGIKPLLQAWTERHKAPGDTL